LSGLIVCGDRFEIRIACAGPFSFGLF